MSFLGNFSGKLTSNAYHTIIHTPLRSPHTSTLSLHTGLTQNRETGKTGKLRE